MGFSFSFKGSLHIELDGKRFSYLPLISDLSVGQTWESRMFSWYMKKSTCTPWAYFPLLDRQAVNSCSVPLRSVAWAPCCPGAGSEKKTFWWTHLTFSELKKISNFQPAQVACALGKFLPPLFRSQKAYLRGWMRAALRQAVGCSLLCRFFTGRAITAPLRSLNPSYLQS